MGVMGGTHRGRTRNDRATRATRASQAERRAAGQARLLDAVVDCLAERGYAGTTTVAVGRRAGVSRGALLHYYRSKADLLVAGLAHVMDRLGDEFRQAMADADPGSARLDTAIDALWSAFQGRVAAAWLELRVAARTDTDLARALRSLEDDFYRRATDDFLGIFPEAGRTGIDAGVMLRFTFAVLDGLVFQTLLPGDDTSRAREQIDVFKAGARELLAPALASA